MDEDAVTGNEPEVVGADSDGDGIGSGSGIEGIRTVNPTDGTVTPAKRRGRPPGSKNRGTAASDGATRSQTAKGKTPQVSVGGIEKILFSIHQMGAAFIAPELELSQEESKELTAALAEVNSFYSQVIDPKIIAWMGLIGVAGKIYGPRLGAVMIRRRMEKDSEPKPTKPTLVPPPTPKSAHVAQAVMNKFSDPSFVSTPSE